MRTSGGDIQNNNKEEDVVSSTLTKSDESNVDICGQDSNEEHNIINTSSADIDLTENSSESDDSGELKGRC